MTKLPGFPIALALCLLSACTKSEPPAPQAGEVPKEKWVDAMSTAMPTMLCPAKGFFRTCFSLSEEECLENASRATKACLLKLELPATLVQPKDGEEWGKKLAICTGETLEVALAGKKTHSPDCNDPAKWSE